MTDIAQSVAGTAVAPATTLDINQIMRILPHRFPFLLIDRVTDLRPKQGITAIKNVTINEPFFAGHFPAMPIMPGVLIVEAMAQAGGVLLLTEYEDRDRKLFLFGGIDKARFRRPVVPGDQLRLECEVLQARRNTVRMRGVATVDGAIAAEAEMLSVMTERP